MCTALKELQHNDDSGRTFIPSKLSFAEALLVKKSQIGENVHSGDSFYLNSVDISDTVKPQESNEAEYEYFMKQSLKYNERLTKESSNEQLWLEFVRFQDRAFVHLFRGSVDASVSSQRGAKNNRALAERKLSLLEAGMKKCPHGLTLQFERLAVGDELWELEQRNKEWASLVYNFPNNMTVWHRLVPLCKFA